MKTYNIQSEIVLKFSLFNNKKYNNNIDIIFIKNKIIFIFIKKFIT